MNEAHERIIIFVLIFMKLTLTSFVVCHRVEKRFLIFPQGGPARYQFICGFGIPLDLDYESVTSGFVFKAQYLLPYNATMLRPVSVVPQFTRKRRNVDSNEYSNDPDFQETHSSHKTDGPVSTKLEDFMTRYAVYEAIEQTINRNGFHGRHCLLRAVCELSQMPFSEDLSVLERLANILLLPSFSSDEMQDDTQMEFFGAEYHGRMNVSCKEKFNKCPVSLLDRISLLF